MRFTPPLLALVLATFAVPPAHAGLPASGRVEKLAIGAPTGILRVQEVSPERAAIAALEARLQEMEETIRRLNGQIEESNYRQQQLEAKVGRLEQVRPAPAVTPEPSATAPAEPILAARPRVPASPTTPAPARDAEGRELAPGEQTLGSVSPGDVEALPPANPAPVGPRTQYEAAMTLLQDGKWDEAEAAFNQVIAAYPKDPVAPNAAYWAGETSYVRKDFTTAAALFARNYRTYGPDSPKAPDNLLKLGMSLAKIGDTDKACQAFDELEKRYPKAPIPIRQTLVRERANAKCA